MSVRVQLKRPEEAEDQKPHPGRRLTEEEFVAWCGPKTRAEWVDGEVILMAPASFDHVNISDWLVAILRVFVAHRDLGTVLSREFFVRFPKQKRRRLPDLLFVSKARRQIIKKQVADGAPDLIIEVVSPDSESRDWRDKYLEYERAGVREYWVIDPMSKQVEAYVLTDAGYAQIAEQNGKLTSTVLSGFFLKVEWLWQTPLPSELKVLRELGVR